MIEYIVNVVSNWQAITKVTAMLVLFATFGVVCYSRNFKEFVEIIGMMTIVNIVMFPILCLGNFIAVLLK